MRAIIIANGSIENTKIISENMRTEDIIICCDGGTRYAYKENIIPEYIIGDLDSSDKNIIEFYKNKNVEFKKFPTKKDNTDMELCIDFAISLKVSEILIFGALGTRFDHSLANVNVLIHALEKNVSAKIIDEYNEIEVINKKTEVCGKQGDLVSLIPISSEVLGVSTIGLEYPLNNFTMKIGSALGVSNVMLAERATIDLESGYLSLIKARDM